MTLVRFNQPLVNKFFNHEFNKFFNESDNRTLKNNYDSLPAVNVKEDEAGFKIEVAAPGLKKENFKINLQENRLTISASQEEKSEETSEKYTRKEFSFSSFQRTFTLPKNVNGEKIEASYTDGILYLSLPKKEEEKPALKEITVA